VPRCLDDRRKSRVGAHAKGVPHHATSRRAAPSTRLMPSALLDFAVNVFPTVTGARGSDEQAPAVTEDIVSGLDVPLSIVHACRSRSPNCHCEQVGRQLLFVRRLKIKRGSVWRSIALVDTRTNEGKSARMSEYEERYQILRDYVKHEDTLINFRQTWTIAVQGFLFAAYGTGLDKLHEDHCQDLAKCRDLANLVHWIIPPCALFIAMSGLWGLRAARIALEQIKVSWNEYELECGPVSAPLTLPPVTGGGNERARVAGFLASFGPGLVICATWLGIISAHIYAHLGNGPPPLVLRATLEVAVVVVVAILANLQLPRLPVRGVGFARWTLILVGLCMVEGIIILPPAIIAAQLDLWAADIVVADAAVLVALATLIWRLPRRLQQRQACLGERMGTRFLV
jgi:hypothetical protein